MTLKRIKTFIFLGLAKLPMKGQIRCKLVKLGGVDCADAHSYIGSSVEFDTINPQCIHIGKNVHITSRVAILTHYLNTDGGPRMWRYGHVYIGDYTFVGTGTVIAKDVRIGNHCIIGAGSVVTKDIPDWEVWAGNPARFIKKKGAWEWE